MEFFVILAIIILSYMFLRFINRVLYRLQHPPFDANAYYEAMLDTVNKYRDNEHPTKAERIRNDIAELKKRKDVRQAIETELNIKM